MQSFARGWSFLQQAWQMALKDKDLIKPSIYSLFAGIVVSLIGIVPLIGVGLLVGDSQFGNVVMFILGAIMLFVNYIVSYVFSAMTVYLIYGYLSEGDGRMEKAWAVVRRDFFDIATLAAASTAVNLLTSSMRNSRSRSGGARAVGGMLAGLISTVWTEAAFLLLPVMVIDDLNLAEALKRVGQIVKKNLLLIGVSTVGVQWVTGLIGFVLVVIGAALGFGVGSGLVIMIGSSALGYAVGIGSGLLLFFVFAMIASILSTYTGTAYHTCLYLWAREVEKAQASGKPIQVAAPAPLAAVLN